MPSRPSLGRLDASRTLVAAVVVFSLFAAGCGGSDREPGAAIATNQGALSVKPPDVLDGTVEETAPVAPDVAPPVEGLEATPIVEFVYFDGTQGSTAEFAGRPVVLNFWASNCPPCIAEMPEFEAASQALAGQVDFVGMNVNDVSREAALELAAQTGVTYPLAEDVGAQVFSSFGAFVMPTTIFLNPQGQVAYAWFGVLTGDELRKLIDEHIAPGTADV